MPNYVINRITTKSKSDLNKIKEALITNDEVDFNKVIPEPKTKEECPPEFVNNNKGLQALEGKDWFNWYDWRIENWGTKWGAETIDTNDEITFTTAWSSPAPVMFALSKEVPTVEFTLDYADEDVGYNCGTVVFKGGKAIKDTEGNEKFARDLWGFDE